MKEMPAISLQVHLSNQFDLGLLGGFYCSLLKIHKSFGFYLSANKVVYCIY